MTMVQGNTCGCSEGGVAEVIPFRDNTFRNKHFIIEVRSFWCKEDKAVQWLLWLCHGVTHGRNSWINRVVGVESLRILLSKKSIMVAGRK